MDDVTRMRDKVWYRKTMRQLTKEQLGKELEEKIRKGEISVDEAEHEYQDFVRQGENTFLGIYGW